MVLPAIKQATIIKKPLVRGLKKAKRYIPASLQKSLRYPALLGNDWKILPVSIQQRFIKWTPSRKVTIYQGRVLETRFSALGRFISVLCWLIGNPLPSKNNMRGPATVIVREADDFDGQIWTRIYPRKKKVPQVIQSIKLFTGKSGLEEMVSTYFGVSLKLYATSNQLSFISDCYFLKIRNKKFTIPGWLTPGTLTVTHKESGPKRFRFTLELCHPIFGELIFQTAIFEEIEL